MNLFSPGPCPVCGDPILVLKALASERLFYCCPFCGPAWLRPPEGRLDELDPIETFAPSGTTLPTDDEILTLSRSVPVERIDFDSNKHVLGYLDTYRADAPAEPSGFQSHPDQSVDMLLRADEWRQQLAGIARVEEDPLLAITHRQSILDGLRITVAREEARLLNLPTPARNSTSHHRLILLLFAEVVRTMDGPDAMEALLPVVGTSTATAIRIADYGVAAVDGLVAAHESGGGLFTNERTREYVLLALTSIVEHGIAPKPWPEPILMLARRPSSTPRHDGLVAALRQAGWRD